ncbi:hypothetical protein LOC54_04130 [Acetobacter sp. AN02]|uniref:hypothetical protein n=1 Tax=Acetobacter sp. AN02 TaxID=2894186 RepID=UPI00243433F8|nr:hypothetical protein [Acetobacter sp. AN02]MDG6094304.1 hypothetical protein [Acetobacter sp. AN02]
MTATPAEDFLKPGLKKLVSDAAAAGITPDVSVAVLLSLLDTMDFGPQVAAESVPGDEG